jgi:hypothetical protein
MNWRLRGSNNGGVSWITLDTRVNQTFNGNFQKRTYAVANTNAYNVYRFQIDRVYDPAAGCVQLDELEFLGYPPPYTYWWSFGDGATSTMQSPEHTYTANGAYTVMLVVSDGLSSATNTVTILAAPPTLGIAPASSGESALSWPAWAAHFTLYSATNLSPPVTWSPVTNVVSSQGDMNTVTTPLDPGSRFFQLRMQ